MFPWGLTVVCFLLPGVMTGEVLLEFALQDFKQRDEGKNQRNSLVHL